MAFIKGQFQGDPEKHAPRMYGDKAARFVKADERQTFRELLSHQDHVVSGVPTFFIVAKATPYYQRFLESIA